MDIGKPAATGGPDLTSLKGQTRDPGRTGEAGRECGECNPDPTGPGGASVAAQLEISAEGLARAERQEALQLAKERYRTHPEIRQEVIARVKERLEQGFYESESVQGELGRRLAQVIRRWPS